MLRSLVGSEMCIRDRIGTGFTTGGTWQSVLYNGGYTVIMNNGIDAPHYITYGTDGRPQELTLQPLPDWPNTLAARVVKTAGYALIAGNLTDSSGSFESYQPGTIRISSQAAPGGVPSSWTIGPVGNVVRCVYAVIHNNRVATIV